MSVNLPVVMVNPKSFTAADTQAPSSQGKYIIL